MAAGKSWYLIDFFLAKFFDFASPAWILVPMLMSLGSSFLSVANDLMAAEAFRLVLLPAPNFQGAEYQMLLAALVSDDGFDQLPFFKLIMAAKNIKLYIFNYTSSWFRHWISTSCYVLICCGSNPNKLIWMADSTKLCAVCEKVIYLILSHFRGGS